MRPAYVMTWIQDGNYMSFTPRSQNVSEVIQIWVNGCFNFLEDSCSDNRLFDGLRLVAREASYKGV